MIGNGDVVDGASARRLRAVSGCDGVMLGRGALGNPWIYRELDAAFTQTPPLLPPGVRERKAALLRHIELLCQYHPNPVGPLHRVICWYFKEVPGVKPFRDAITRAQTLAQMRELLEAFVP